MATQPHPTEIKYSREDRALTVSFDSGEVFEFSAEFLRVHSPSAEVRGHGPGQEVLQIGKEDAAIEAIEPIGNYAVRLSFADDGLTMGTNHHLGLCIGFVQRIPKVIGFRDHSALWVSVADPEGLAEALESPPG